MRQYKERFDENNIKVIVITFENESHALDYNLENALEWPLAIDRSREMYDYFGMGKARFRDLWGPASLLAYFRELLKGNMPRAAHDDIYQRGGDVLIDPEGMVRLHYIGKGPADRPDIADIMKIVEGKKAKFPGKRTHRTFRN